MPDPPDRKMTEELPSGQQVVPRGHFSMPGVEPSGQWLAASLEEYKAIRAEIVDSIQAQRQIMQVGVTGLSVLVGFGLQHIDPLLAIMLLMLLVPILAIFTTVSALGEFFRAARASSFLAYRETVINLSVPGAASEPKPVAAQEWEQWLRRNPVYIVRDWAQFLAIFSINTGALALGFYTIVTSNFNIDRPAPFVLAIVVVALILWMICPLLHVYLLRQARRQFWNVPGKD